VNRRAVLKTVLLGGTALGATAALGGLFDVVTLPDGRRVALARAVVVANPNLCSGCRVCEVVCSNAWTGGRNGTSLSRVILDKDYVGGTYRPKTCWQCAEPPCLDACPVTALVVDRRSGTYARVIDERACIGCRKCVEACGRWFDPPRPRFDAEGERVIKCHLCFGEPACVEHCPLGALTLVRSEHGLRMGYPVVSEVART
jgi:anaerobic carbon-monoxide dehydrogenase iron sulfur subunit